MSPAVLERPFEATPAMETRVSASSVNRVARGMPVSLVRYLRGYLRLVSPATRVFWGLSCKGDPL